MMKKQLSVILLSGILLATTGQYASAQNGGPINEGNAPAAQQRKQPGNQNGKAAGNDSRQAQEQRQHQEPRRQSDNARSQHQPQRSQTAHQPSRQREANVHPTHNFRKGKPLPQQYRDSAHRIDDWRKRGLPAPPNGHRWVKVDNDYVLIAIASGVITSILLHQ